MQVDFGSDAWQAVLLCLGTPVETFSSSNAHHPQDTSYSLVNDTAQRNVKNAYFTISGAYPSSTGEIQQIDDIIRIVQCIQELLKGSCLVKELEAAQRVIHVSQSTQHGLKLPMSVGLW